jgi:hypothetical protein
LVSQCIQIFTICTFKLWSDFLVLIWKWLNIILLMFIILLKYKISIKGFAFFGLYNKLKFKNSTSTIRIRKRCYTMLKSFVLMCKMSLIWSELMFNASLWSFKLSIKALPGTVSFASLDSLFNPSLLHFTICKTYLITSFLVFEIRDKKWLG